MVHKNRLSPLFGLVPYTHMIKKLFSIVVFVASLQSPMAFAAGDDTMNFRFSPIDLLVGSMAIGFDYVIAPEWTLGPEINFWNFNVDSNSSLLSEYKVKSFGIGARANWFYNGVYTDGLYLGPALTYRSVNIETRDSGGKITADASTMVLAGMVGYGWFWESFNIMLGGGLAVPVGDTKIEITDSTGRKESVNYQRFGSLALEFNLGWTF